MLAAEDGPTLWSVPGARSSSSFGSRGALGFELGNKEHVLRNSTNLHC